MSRNWPYGMLLPPYTDAMTVIITDMLPWTSQIRYHHLAHWHAAEVMPPTGA